MGSFDGAEICELVGLFLLSQLQHLNINVGLYRDDGLAATNQTPRNADKIKKEICKIFKENGLSITADANKKVVDFLDVTLNLSTGLYQPYQKPNNKINYIHRDCNHPPPIIKNLSKGIAFRLSNNSANFDIFNKAAKPYHATLRTNGHKQQIQYTKSDKPDEKATKGNHNHTTGEINTPPNEKRDEKSNKRIRKRKIIWFNPPFSVNVATNIGKMFFGLLHSCFPTNNKLHKILNKNTVKLSYSCMQNMKHIISNHNKTVLESTKVKESQGKTCNCRDKQSCPLNGQCLQRGVVYKATVEQIPSKTQDTYIGITENEFKTRYNQHTSSFRLNHKKSATTLSELIWKLKESKTAYHLSWAVIERAQPYSAATNRCNLCTAEKYFILHTKPSLNKRREIFSSCPHRKKHLLQNYQWPGNENKQQHKVGTASANEHTSVIPEESGGPATALSSA